MGTKVLLAAVVVFAALAVVAGLTPPAAAYDNNTKGCVMACALTQSPASCASERSVPRCRECVQKHFDPCKDCMKKCGLDDSEASFECKVEPDTICRNVAP